MKNKDIKKLQINYAKTNIEFFLKLLKENFNPDFNKLYIKEIKRLSQGFNIRLNREQKLQFCKKCNIYWSVDTRQIRLNSKDKTKEYICKKCGHVKRIKL